LKADVLKEVFESIKDSLIKSINNFGHASIVVCGGNSPLPLYKKLSYADLDWKKVSIYLGDDRQVSNNHDDSNEKLIQDHLLINNASSANFFSILNPLTKIENIKFPFDIVMLGLGLDGHFASLFPSQLNESNIFDIDAEPSFIFSKQPMGAPSYKRVSMNLSMLLNTRRCILLVTNNEKRKIIDKAFKDDQLPLYYLLNQEVTPIECSDNFT
tara:strand:+ start:332 stop:970 length:639 start_codon:yes stop_codon:yes gene_type:complete